MSTAALDARLVGGDRLVYACVAVSLALHASLVLYAPRVKPKEEPAPRITATIRADVPVPAPAPEPVRQSEPAPAAKPEPPPPVATPAKPEPAPQPVPPPRAERPRSADPSPATTVSAPVPAPAASPSVAPPVAAPAPAAAPPVEARSEARAERGAPIASSAAPSAVPAQAPEVSERELVAQYQVQIAGIVETRKLKRYPSEAMQNGWEGTSMVLLRIGTDGKVAGVETAASSGHDMLDEQARISISRAKPFVPIPEGLRGRAFEARVRVVFSLKGL